MKPINNSNYKSIERDLNRELQADHLYESWMEFTVKLMEGSKDIYLVDFMLPISKGITTEVSPEEAISLYKDIISRVAPQLV